MLSINFSELIWTIVDFFLLFFILRRLLFSPLLDFMEKRDARIAAGEQAVRDAEEKIRAQQLANDTFRDESSRLARELIEKASAKDAERHQQVSRELRENIAADRISKEQKIRSDCESSRIRLSADSDRLAHILTDALLENDT